MDSIRNVVIICEYAQFSGGSQNIAIGSAIDLARRGYNVIFFTAIGELCDELKNSNVIVKHIQSKNITEDKNIFAAAKRGIWNGNAAKELRKILNSLKKEETIVHVHNWSNVFSSSIVKMLLDLDFKTVITLHDYLIVCPNGGFYDYKHKKICTYEPMSMKCIFCNCDRRSYPQKLYRVAREIVQNRYIRNNEKLNFITISNFNDSLIRPRIRSKKIHRVNNFVQIETTKDFERNESKTYICVGRVVEEKGIEVFCRAICLLKNKYPEIKGQVIGSGPLLDKFKSKYPEVEFLGWVTHNDVEKIMSNARCLVFPSVIYECSPLTVIEALSKKLPCIVSDCTAATELIKDKVNGFLFKAGDSSDLAKKMEDSMAAEKYEFIINNIRKSFDASAYTCSSYTDRVLEVYKEIEGDNK